MRANIKQPTVNLGKTVQLSPLQLSSLRCIEDPLPHHPHKKEEKKEKQKKEKKESLYHGGTSTQPTSRCSITTHTAVSALLLGFLKWKPKCTNNSNSNFIASIVQITFT
jgi:hypothetical protein